MSSNPTTPTNFYASVPERPNGADCKSVDSLVQIQPDAPIKEVWQSPADCNGLENRRGSDTTVSSNLTASAKFNTENQ